MIRFGYNHIRDHVTTSGQDIRVLKSKNLDILCFIYYVQIWVQYLQSLLKLLDALCVYVMYYSASNIHWSGTVNACILKGAKQFFFAVTLTQSRIQDLLYKFQTTRKFTIDYTQSYDFGRAFMIVKVWVHFAFILLMQSF